MKVVSVVGARPQFIKLKPLDAALVQGGHEHTVVHTGQHYDAAMSQAFFEGLSLPDPAVNLEVGSRSHSQQVAQIMERLQPFISGLRPDWMLVYGDTNSTLAAALVGAQGQTKVAHVEAGLRSRNRAMPEELNRTLVDHASDLLLAPSELAMRNLEAEGLSGRSHLVGDVMVDLLADVLQHQERRQTLANLTASDYIVATIHRASNTDDPLTLDRLLRALGRLQIRVILVAHPRLRRAADLANLTLERGNVVSVPPLPYLDMVNLMRGSQGVVTDSGGLQKEAFLLSVPCTTLRAETEWPETLANRQNVLDPRGDRLAELACREASPLNDNPYGDGKASLRIVKLLETRTSDGGVTR